LVEESKGASSSFVGEDTIGASFAGVEDTIGAMGAVGAGVGTGVGAVTATSDEAAGAEVCAAGLSLPGGFPPPVKTGTSGRVGSVPSAGSSPRKT